MENRLAIMAVLLLPLAGTLAGANELFPNGPASGRLLAAGNNRVMVLSPTGEVLWQYSTKLTHDCWLLPSGNVLFADGESVTEVRPDKKVVFQYKAAEQKGGGTYACQRLENGLTLVGENSTGRILEIGADGRIAFSLATTPCQPGNHHNLRMVRKLENGNYLACHSGARLVKEYSPQGEVVGEIKVPGRLAFAALRTAKGTTLVTCLDQVIEYDKSGQPVWSFSVKELPETPIQNLTGLHLLPNGHLVLGCYQAYRNGEGSGLLEISREKRLIWRYANPKSDSTMMAVQLLTADGKPLEGPCRR